MIRNVRAWTGALLTTIVLIVPAALHADTVQVTIHDGRVTLVATNATPAQIFDAWSRAGGVLIVNADRMPTTPLTLTLDNVPEEQALETVLRPVTGYLARRRMEPSAPNASVFDRIVIMPTPAAATPPPSSPLAPPVRPAGGAQSVFPQPARPFSSSPPAPPAQPAPQGIQVAPGVTRLVGPDGQPVEDDQADAPQPYNAGDAPDRRGNAPPPQRPPMPPPAQPAAPGDTGAPVGVPRPGMVVPSPASPQTSPQQPPR